MKREILYKERFTNYKEKTGMENNIDQQSGQSGNEKKSANQDTQIKYSDSELKEFKILILAKLQDAQADYELLNITLTQLDDHGTNDTSPTFKLLEDAAELSSKEETAQLATRQKKFIEHLQNALIRIENKTYGICRLSGKLISKDRLRSVPHATTTIDAKLDKHKN